MNPTLMKAILAMDSYNRGYSPGIQFGNLPNGDSIDSSGVMIGNAKITTNSGIFINNGNRTDDDISFLDLVQIVESIL